MIRPSHVAAIDGDNYGESHSLQWTTGIRRHPRPRMYYHAWYYRTEKLSTAYSPYLLEAYGNAEWLVTVLGPSYQAVYA